MTWSDQNNETFYKRMIETLRLAASAPDLQLDAFPLWVDRPGEIATEVDDCFLYVRKLREAGDISADILEGYRKLNDHLDFPAGSELWSEESVKTSALWREARELAQGVLDNMGVKYARPDLFWVL